MSIALWCVLAVAFMPLVLTAIAKSGGGYDNADPRGYLKGVSGFRYRANNAQQNGFEAFPLFAAAVIVAEMKNGPSGTVDALAVAFLLARVAYAALYMADRPSLRSLAWMIGLALTVAIFTSPAWR